MGFSSYKKALVAGVSGTALQWYDFALFGYFAPIIAQTYFPSDNNFASLLSTFSIFAIGYLAAPLGSILFGTIGDRFGRKRALTISILAMAIPTSLISITPGYKHIGFLAPLLITFLRVIQGFVASSEFTSSAIFLVEHATPKNRAFYGCLTSCAYSSGMILAGLAASFFTAEFMPQWGWRVGFGLAIVAGILIFFLRKHVAESPGFNSDAVTQKNQLPILSAIKENPLAIIGILGLSWLVSIMTFGTYVFAATYLNMYLSVSLSTATLIITMSLVVDAVLEPFIAILADRVGYKRIIVFGMYLFLLLSFPIFYLISTGNIILISLGMISLSILIAITYAPLNAYMVLLFPREYRCSGFSVAFNTGISIFGGTAPLVMMWLVHRTGSLIIPAGYYVFGATVGIFSIFICEYSYTKKYCHSSIIAINQ